jgi:hypothetical protein
LFKVIVIEAFAHVNQINPVVMIAGITQSYLLVPNAPGIANVIIVINSPAPHKNKHIIKPISAIVNTSKLNIYEAQATHSPVEAIIPDSLRI